MGNFNRMSLILILLCFTYGTLNDLVFAISVKDDLRNIHPDLFDSNLMLKPVREVVDEFSAFSRDFPRIYPCGPDEAQNWYEPDPETCKCYYECTGVWYEHRSCPEELLYDVRLKQCNWASQVDCGERPRPVFPEMYEGPAHHIYHPPHDKILTLSRKKNESQKNHSDFSSPNFYDDEEDYELFM